MRHLERGRVLWVLRHASASRGPLRAAAGDVKGRYGPRLDAGGEADAEALGRRLGPDGDRLGLPEVPLPQLVWCSEATRAVETCERVIASIDPPPTVIRDTWLSGGMLNRVEPELSELPSEVRSVMVIAHQPGVGDLVGRLWRTGNHRRRYSSGVGLAPADLAVLWLPPRGRRGRLLGLFEPPY